MEGTRQPILNEGSRKHPRARQPAHPFVFIIGKAHASFPVQMERERKSFLGFFLLLFRVLCLLHEPTNQPANERTSKQRNRKEEDEEEEYQAPGRYQGKDMCTCECTRGYRLTVCSCPRHTIAIEHCPQPSNTGKAV